MEEKRKVRQNLAKEISMSFSTLKPKKLGRKLSRSMSIVTMKLPEKRTSYFSMSRSKVPARTPGGVGGRKKGEWTVELSVIAPDSTQRRITSGSNQKIHQILEPLLKEFNLALINDFCDNQLSTQNTSKNYEAENDTTKNEDKKEDSVISLRRTLAYAVLGGSKAPVNVKATASLLEGEVLVLLDYIPPWDGKDLNLFLLTEKQFASVIGSALELYGKPLLKADIINKREYRILFYHLYCVNQASRSLCERLENYMNAGLFKTDSKESNNSCLSETTNEDVHKSDGSILEQLVKEGFLSHKDVELANLYDSPSSNKPCDTKTERDEVDCTITENFNVPKITLSECDKPVAKKTLFGIDCSIGKSKPNDESLNIESNPIPPVFKDNLWQNVKWDFLENQNKAKENTDEGSTENMFSPYDSVRKIKRCHSDTLLCGGIELNESIYESLEDIPEKQTSDCITPYESIEELYESLKKHSQNPNVQVYDSVERSKSTDKLNTGVNFFDGLGMIRKNSARSIKSGSLTSFATSHTCDTFNKPTSDTSNESIVAREPNAEYTSKLFPNRPSTPDNCSNFHLEDNENTILLNQLINGDLMDVYSDFLSGYAEARSLLREKIRHDEHFTALVDIRRGAAQYSIADYLQLPVSAHQNSYSLLINIHVLVFVVYSCPRTF